MVSSQWCLCLAGYRLHDCWPDELSCLDAGSSLLQKAMAAAGNRSDALDVPVSGNFAVIRESYFNLMFLMAMAVTPFREPPLSPPHLSQHTMAAEDLMEVPDWGPSLEGPADYPSLSVKELSRNRKTKRKHRHEDLELARMAAGMVQIDFAATPGEQAGP